MTHRGPFQPWPVCDSVTLRISEHSFERVWLIDIAPSLPALIGVGGHLPAERWEAVWGCIFTSRKFSADPWMLPTCCLHQVAWSHEAVPSLSHAAESSLQIFLGCCLLRLAAAINPTPSWVTFTKNKLLPLDAVWEFQKFFLQFPEGNYEFLTLIKTARWI